MDSRRENDRLAHSDIDRVRQEVRDDEHVDVIASQGFAKNGFADLVFVLKGAHFVDKVALVTVGERIAVSKENRVVVICVYNNRGRSDNLSE